MKKIKSVEEAIEFAIEQEDKTFSLYNDLAEKTTNAHSRDVIEGFAAEELAHRRKLEIMRAHIICVKNALKKADDNKLLTIEKPGKVVQADVNMDLKKALQFAMYMEQKAESLYLHLADACPDHDLKAFFQILTEEEILHYKRYQKIYNDTYCQPKPIKPAEAPKPVEQRKQPAQAPKTLRPSPQAPEFHEINWVDLDPV
jgi:rubrerythrin